MTTSIVATRKPVHYLRYCELARDTCASGSEMLDFLHHVDRTIDDEAWIRTLEDHGCALPVALLFFKNPCNEAVKFIVGAINRESTVAPVNNDDVALLLAESEMQEYGIDPERMSSFLNEARINNGRLVFQKMVASQGVDGTLTLLSEALDVENDQVRDGLGMSHPQRGM